MHYTNLNGKITATDDTHNAYDNRAFRQGYGIFESLLIKDGMIQLREYHWQRLFAGLAQLHFTLPAHFTPSWLEEELMRSVRKNKLEELCRIRLQIFAGAGGIYDSPNIPEYIIQCSDIAPHITTLNENGLVVGIATGLQKSIDSLSHLKTCSSLMYAMAAQQAKAHKWNDALLLNTKGNIVESTIANIFWVKDGIIYTPPLTEGCIAGTLRAYLLDVLPTKGYGVQEQPLTNATLLTADEVFLTNAIRGVKWVGTVENKVYRNEVVRTITYTLNA